MQEQVPIKAARLTLSVDSSLRDEIKTDLVCYVGKYGSGTRFTASSDDLGNGQGMTVVLGFAPHIFTKHTATFAETH